MANNLATGDCDTGECQDVNLYRSFINGSVTPERD